MKVFGIYAWFLQSKNDFIGRFCENETLYNKALRFWNAMEGTAVILLVACVVIGILVAAYYYTRFNNQPGRHYKFKYWVEYLFCSAGCVFWATLILEYVLIDSSLLSIDSAKSEILKLSVLNACYAFVVYFITSVVWCNFLPTNACRFLKP